ncbi:glycosyltransferase family 2 protein [Actinomycetospora chlora]|uniref:glycosyltransferase family 2 protein n=1 Tax=Actinomycetospora chlora TaxID=663608 RepID=UPI0031EA79BF
MARPPAVAPVLAVLVCHDGEPWLPETLGALGRLTRRPRWVIAVDTGSTDGTAALLAASNQVDVVLRMPRDTGFAEAVHTAVDDADRRWGRHADRGSGDWLWVLHDDAAPAPDCLGVLLSVADASPSAAILGPLCLDWDDPRLVVEAGVSIDASGTRQTGIGADELDLGQFATNSEVLAVGSAGSLVRRREWDSLGGYDTALGLLREDVDLGWRVNRAGGLVLCAPSARLRHARALATRTRTLDTAGVDPRYRATDRAHGVRTFLANCSSPAFVLGLLRLPVLAVLRALGLLLVRRTRAAGAELAGLGRVLGSGPGIADLADARRRRSTGATALPRELRGLLTSRTTRLRNAVRGGLTSVVRGRLREELDLGRLPDWAERESRDQGLEGGGERRAVVGPDALPVGAAAGVRRTRRTAGLRRPGESLAVALPGPRTAADDTAGAPTAGPAAGPAAPSPAPAGVRVEPETAPGERVVVVPITAGRVARELLLAPPLLLVVGLTLISLATQRARLGLGLAGGRIAEVPGLRELWSSYLASWHPVAGGTGAPAAAALAVVGVLGGPVAPLGGPPAAVSLLLVAALPLAGLSAYLATRELRVGRVLRALAAAVYALLGITAGAVAQGRLDGVVAAVLLPLVLAGVVAVLRGVRVAGRRGSWWSTAAGTALALGVVGAFAPLVYALVLVVVVIGFVGVAAPPRAAGRRAMALAVIVVLPVLLLLPWPAALLSGPEILLHGTGAPVAERFASPLGILSLDPGGPGTLPWAGLLLVVLAVGGALVAPRRAAVPGLALLLLGVVTAGVVGSFALAPLSGGDPRPGWTGPALAVATCGALWSLLAQVAAARTEPLGRLIGRRDPVERAPARRGESELDLGGAGLGGRLAGAAEQAGAGMSGLAGRLRPRSRTGDDRTRARGVAVPEVATAVAVLAVVTVLGGGGGPLADRPAPALAAPLAADLTRADAGVVVVTRDADTTRRAGPTLPRYGDDDLAPVGAAPARLQRDVRALLSGDPATVQAGVAELATAGTGAVVLPDEPTARIVRTAAGPLLADAPPTSDGRPVARVALPVAGAVLLEPPVSDDATESRAAPRRPAGLTAVPSDLPTVAVRVSPGADRRLLVLAAEQESGWRATVGGQPVSPVPAWGHLVGVPVPPGGGAVVVDRDETVRLLLLLLQLALVLFTALSALPSRTRLD